MSQPERISPKHETVMDVTVERLARVYAKAFMDAVAKSANADALVEELQSIVADVLDRFPRLEQVLKSALVSAEQKEEVLDRIFGKSASTQVVNFLKVLSRHNRLDLLRSIVREAKKLRAQRAGMADVEVRVAQELDDGLLKDLKTRLQKTLGKEPNLSIKLDPRLIAGIVVRVGDRVYDGSVYTQLERARQAMIARATDQIETQPDRFVSAS
jgi:F-type H+-transporting ATPase subunit delta